MTLKDDLQLLDKLTDAEADNLYTAKRQGDLPEHMAFTWAIVSDSWVQMPEDIQAKFGDPAAITAALTRVQALIGQEAEVIGTYQLPDYEALGQTPEEIEYLVKHDRDEELHAFVPGAPGVTPEWACGECGDTAEGLMHNNTWRNVEPLMEDSTTWECILCGAENERTEGGGTLPCRDCNDKGDGPAEGGNALPPHLVGPTPVHVDAPSIGDGPTLPSLLHNDAAEQQEFRRFVVIDDDTALQVVVTNEGVIYDLIELGDVVNTQGETFAEIADRLSQEV